MEEVEREEEEGEGEEEEEESPKELESEEEEIAMAGRGVGFFCATWLWEEEGVCCEEEPIRKPSSISSSSPTHSRPIINPVNLWR